MAKAQLAQELPDISFYQHVTAEVYVGLTDEQCLRLAQRHNNSLYTLDHSQRLGKFNGTTYSVLLSKTTL